MIQITVKCSNADEINKVIMTKKKAVLDYKRLRDDVMADIKKFLTQTQQGFTSKELSEKFGLPANIIARMARIYGIWTRDRVVIHKYARLTDDGEVNFNDVKEIRYKCKEYYVYTY
jgi:hypothetical protein